MKKRIVIIGGCAAGPKCAAKSRRLDDSTEILLYTQGENVSYSACGLPYYIGGAVNDINALIARTPEEFAQNGIQIFLNHQCSEILPGTKEVIVNDEKISYDELVLATGAVPFIPPIKNVGLRNIMKLRLIQDGIAVKELMKESKSVLIVGCGYIAIEMIEAFLKNGLKVYVIERSKHIMSFLDADFSDIVEKYILERHGASVEIIKDEVIDEFFGDGKFEGAITNKGRVIEADFCLLATGVRPNVQLARDCGIEIGVTGGIKVDNKMRTNIENIWAAGDCTQKHCLVADLPVYIGLGSVANKEGRVCAINMNGQEEVLLGVLGSAITKYFNYTISVTGITQKRAESIAAQVNYDLITTTVTKMDKVAYMPDVKPITIKLVADRNSGRILGAQGVGEGDVDKRISIITSALQKKMTVDELLHLDLTYTPPTSGTIDPLLTACYELKKQM